MAPQGGGSVFVLCASSPSAQGVSGVTCPRQGTQWAEGSHALNGESNPGKDRVGSTAQWGFELPVGASEVLTPCPTAPAPGQQACGVEERCSQGSCLAPNRFCDGTDDCGDGSDETAQHCREHLQPQGVGGAWMGRGSDPVGPWDGTGLAWVVPAPPWSFTAAGAKSPSRLCHGETSTQPIMGPPRLGSAGPPSLCHCSHSPHRELQEVLL